MEKKKMCLKKIVQNSSQGQNGTALMKPTQKYNIIIKRRIERAHHPFKKKKKKPLRKGSQRTKKHLALHFQKMKSARYHKKTTTMPNVQSFTPSCDWLQGQEFSSRRITPLCRVGCGKVNEACYGIEKQYRRSVQINVPKPVKTSKWKKKEIKSKPDGYTKAYTV